MTILTKITDLLYRKQKTLEIIAIFLFFSLVAFRIEQKHIKLLWSNNPFVAVSLALIIALIAIVWIRIEKQKTQQLIIHLQNKEKDRSAQIESKLLDLSSRQREVFNLIVKGKSNKEITSELNIELSTLKTHINQLYKTLGIKSRKETRNFDHEIDSIK
ncbi:MAG: response regulator transcription factor [Candidatus Saccharimonadaceae bacterium]